MVAKRGVNTDENELILSLRYKTVVKVINEVHQALNEVRASIALLRAAQLPGTFDICKPSLAAEFRNFQNESTQIHQTIKVYNAAKVSKYAYFLKFSENWCEGFLHFLAV